LRSIRSRKQKAVSGKQKAGAKIKRKAVSKKQKAGGDQLMVTVSLDEIRTSMKKSNTVQIINSWTHPEGMQYL
jgi:hypothetical protein